MTAGTRKCPECGYCDVWPMSNPCPECGWEPPSTRKRREELNEMHDKNPDVFNALAYAYVRGWYDGRGGKTNDDGKRTVAFEEMRKLLDKNAIPSTNERRKHEASRD